MANSTATTVYRVRRLRVARLGSTGDTPSGATNAYIADDMMELVVEREVQEGEELSERNANADFCLDIADDPRTRWLNLTLRMCNHDAQLKEMIAGFALLTEGADTIGEQDPALGVVAPGSGVSLEVWSYNAAADGRGQHLTLPWRRTVFPKTVSWRPEGGTYGNARLENSFVGRALENANWGNGPFNDWDYNSTRVRQSIVTADAPPAATSTYVVVPAQV